MEHHDKMRLFTTVNGNKPVIECSNACGKSTNAYDGCLKTQWYIFIYQINLIYKLRITYQMNVIVYYHWSTIINSWLNKIVLCVRSRWFIHDDGWCDQNML